MLRKEIFITTEKQFISLKDILSDFVKDQKGDGIVNVFVCHTTCGIKVMEGEILLLSDVSSYLEKTFPQNGEYRHDIIAVRDVPIDERINGFSHMRQLFFDTNTSIPVRDGELLLGKWQDVFLIEFDPIRERKLILSYYN